MKLVLLAALLAAPYDVHVKVAWKGQTMERCAVDLVVDGAVAGHQVTKEDGRADFEGLETERFELKVKRDGYFDRRVIVYNFARRDVHEDIDLKKKVPWKLAGTVRGGGTLLPLALVRVLEGGDAPAETTTGPDGSFSFGPLHDTECRFTAEAAGFHRQSVWMANRTQTDLTADVELRPLKEAAGAPWELGEPAPPVEIRYFKRASRRVTPDVALNLLFDTPRIFPDDDRPVGAVSGARIDLPQVGASGTLARAERALTGLVKPYRRKR